MKSSICAWSNSIVPVHAIDVRGLAGRHLEANGWLRAALLEALQLVGGQMKAAPVVHPATARPLGRLTLFFQAIRRAITSIGVPRGEQRLGHLTVPIEALRLEVGCVRPAHFRPFVPVEAEPAHRLEDARHHLVGRTLGVGVFDAQHERAAMAPREQPVEERCSRAADVQVSGGRGSEANPRTIHRRDSIAWRERRAGRRRGGVRSRGPIASPFWRPRRCSTRTRRARMDFPECSPECGVARRRCRARLPSDRAPCRPVR